ncbi:MAG: BON domain-containing protein [Comamonas sp.]
MRFAKIRSLRLLVGVLCLAATGVLVYSNWMPAALAASSHDTWFTQWRAWGHALHQQLRVSGSRVNGVVEHAAQTKRVLAGDDAISAAVADAFAASQSVDLRDLQVDTHLAMVTLSGSVASVDLRERAIALAEKVDGVHGVFCIVDVVPVKVG